MSVTSHIFIFVTSWSSALRSSVYSLTPRLRLPVARAHHRVYGGQRTRLVLLVPRHLAEAVDMIPPNSQVVPDVRDGVLRDDHLQLVEPLRGTLRQALELLLQPVLVVLVDAPTATSAQC